MSNSDPNPSSQERPPWFRTDFSGRLSPSMRHLLTSYSSITEKDIDAHIYSVREKAWQIAPYPCIGGFSFLGFALPNHPKYNAVLEKLKASPSSSDDSTGSEKKAKFIDIGCCFGQEVRNLAFQSGIAYEQLYASDINGKLLELGFELFNDREKWAHSSSPSSFFPMDILDPVVPDNLKFDIIHLAMVFHLFPREKQVDAAINVITNLLVDKPGAMIVGSQAGTINPRSVPSRRIAGRESFLHDTDSFKALWAEVGEKTGTSWEVEAILTKPWEDPENKDLAENDRYFMGEDMRWLVFSITRV